MEKHYGCSTISAPSATTGQWTLLALMLMWWIGHCSADNALDYVNAIHRVPCLGPQVKKKKCPCKAEVAATIDIIMEFKCIVFGLWLGN